MTTLPTGKLILTSEEKTQLQQLRQAAVFTQHEKFAGIWQAEMPFTAVPKQLQDLIESLGGKMTIAKILKVDQKIEKHVHLHDSEIYYYGDNQSEIKLYDQSVQLIETLPFTPETYALTRLNEAHEVIAPAWTEFYGVKFV